MNSHHSHDGGGDEMTDRPKERVARERRDIHDDEVLPREKEEGRKIVDLVVTIHEQEWDGIDKDYMGLIVGKEIARARLEALRSGGEERDGVPELAEGFQCEASCYCSVTPRERRYTDPETGDPLEGYYCDRHWSDDTGPGTAFFEVESLEPDVSDVLYANLWELYEGADPDEGSGEGEEWPGASAFERGYQAGRRDEAYFRSRPEPTEGPCPQYVDDGSDQCHRCGYHREAHGPEGSGEGEEGEGVADCLICGEPATCIGRYEGHGPISTACDTCCGHGNEDGWCVPIQRVSRLLGEEGE